MRIDRYTKIILTLVALLLAVSVLKPILQPPGRHGGRTLQRCPILI
jgi:hypothetical protein